MVYAITHAYKYTQTPTAPDSAYLFTKEPEKESPLRYVLEANERQQFENRREDRKPSYLMVKAGAWGKDAVQLHRFFGWEQVQIAQFAPCAAITGYDSAIKETGRLTDEKYQLPIDDLDEAPEIASTCFRAHDRKAGGAYLTVTIRICYIFPIDF